MNWKKSLIHLMSERMKEIKGVGKVLSVSLLNQVISSGTNFAIGLYLVRALTPSEFGLYGIGFAIALLYSGVGNALFLTQMVVHVPDKAPEDRLPYAARMLITLVMFCIFTGIISSVMVILASNWSSTINEYLPLCVSTIATAIFYVLKDFFVRHAYTARQEIWALLVNVGVAISLFIALLIQHYYFAEINSASALSIYAASNMVGVILGLALVKLPILSIRVHALLSDASESWIGGRWALGGVSVTWLQTQAYMYVTAIFLGPAGVGYVNAARILITPAQFFLPAITQVLMPRLAELRANNFQKMLLVRSMFTIAIVVFAMMYSAVLLTLLEKIVPVLLGSKYKDVGSLAAAWCLVLIFQFSLVGSSIVLQAMKNFRLLMLANIASFAVAIISAVVLMQIIGPQGAVIGSASGDLVLSVILYKAISRKGYDQN